MVWISAIPDASSKKTIIRPGREFAFHKTMAKKKLRVSKKFPYHLYARSNNRDWFYLPSKQIWKICLEELSNVSLLYGFKVHAFVLMSNHFHLIASTPEGNLGEVMNYFMREVSRAVNRKAGRINHVFGGPYKPSLIENPHYYFNVYKYVYQNPIRAEICSTVWDYPFSTIATSYEQKSNPLLFPSFFETHFLLQRSLRWQEWIGNRMDKETNNLLRKGLKKNEFSLGRNRLNRKPLKINEENINEIDALLNQK
jgi:putative transposase